MRIEFAAQGWRIRCFIGFVIFAIVCVRCSADAEEAERASVLSHVAAQSFSSEAEPPSAADAALVWARRWSNPNSCSGCTDAGTFVAADSDGNVIVTGHSDNATGFDPDYATVKYDENGNELWAAIYAGPGGEQDWPNGMAVDPWGNVIVTGGSYISGGGAYNIDWATVKYDPDGNEVWRKLYGGAYNGYDSAFDLAMDGSGNAYVTGCVSPNSFNQNIMTIKYTPAGAVAWSVSFDGYYLDEETGMAIAVDTAGNVYVAGRSERNMSDYVTIKYNSTGQQQWASWYDNPRHGYDAPCDIAVDADGNVIVTGTAGSVATNDDYGTVKYSPAGAELWAMLYEGGYNKADVAEALAVDASGNVYVTGYSRVFFDFPQFATVKYDSDGNEVWVRTYMGPNSGMSRAHAIALDEDGNIYVTGESEGWTTDFDIATIKYRPDGAQEWVARWNGPNNSFDQGFNLTLDRDLNVIVAGDSDGFSNDFDYVTLKYRQTTPTTTTTTRPTTSTTHPTTTTTHTTSTSTTHPTTTTMHTTTTTTVSSTVTTTSTTASGDDTGDDDTEDDTAADDDSVDDSAAEDDSADDAADDFADDSSEAQLPAGAFPGHGAGGGCGC